MARRPAPQPPSRRCRVRRASQRVRTLALGVIVDPNISTPLPFAGLSYVDFNLFGTGTQINGFFGGTYGQLAFSVPSLGGTRWQLAGRAFGIASSYNDRAFVDGREHYEREHLAAPRACVGLAAAAADVAADGARRLRVRLHALRPAPIRPRRRSPCRRRRWRTACGWRSKGSGPAGRRRCGGPARGAAGWRRWGEPRGPAVGVGDYAPSSATSSASARRWRGRSSLSPRLVGRGRGGVDGRTRSRSLQPVHVRHLRQPPARLSVGADPLRSRRRRPRRAAAWSAGRVLRLDGFVDYARTCTIPASGRVVGATPGVGAAVEVPAPFGTLVAVEWGYGFQGVERRRRARHARRPDQRVQDLLTRPAGPRRRSPVTYAIRHRRCLCRRRCRRGSSVAGQQPIRVGVDLVHFGVVVTDKQGAPITGLTQDDFEVVERGKPQQIQFFAAGETARSRRRCTSASCSTPAAAWSRTSATSGPPRSSSSTRTSTPSTSRWSTSTPRCGVARYGADDYPRLIERIRMRKPGGLTALYDALGVYLARRVDAGRPEDSRRLHRRRRHAQLASRRRRRRSAQGVRRHGLRARLPRAPVELVAATPRRWSCSASPR